MGSKTVHMSICVRGLLHKTNRELNKYTKWMLRNDGTRHSVASLREELMDALSHGYEVLPYGKECVGFDKKEGCPGHEEKR